MDVGIRISLLRKVYTSPPPAGALVRGGPMTGVKFFKRPEKKKYAVVALDDVSLEIKPGEIFGLLERFQLTDRADSLVTGFSGGMMQRLSIARALMHDPQVLFLDEPSTGLDPQTRLLLWELIRDFNRHGATVLLTTHNMDEADALCHRLAIVDHGRVIATGTPEELKRSVPGGFVVRLKFDTVSETLAARLAQIPGVTEVQRTPEGGVDLYADRGGTLIPHVVGAAAAAGATISDVHISEPSLENLFLHHTGRSLRQ